MTLPSPQTPFWEAFGLPRPGATLSRAAFDALPEVAFHIEWHDGVVIYPNWNEATMSPSPTSDHQQVVVFTLHALLSLELGGTVVTAPMDVQLGGRVVQPDVFWIAPDGACRDEGGHYVGAPDLIVEVLSPSNTANDRVTKFDLYAAAGVREYWMANPTERYLEVYTLTGGLFRRVGAYQVTDTIPAGVLGHPLPAHRLFGR
jgi:Uma2 family endonuclease